MNGNKLGRLISMVLHRLSKNLFSSNKKTGVQWTIEIEA